MKNKGVEMDTLIKWNVKYNNYLKLDEYYKYLHNWLKDEEYISYDDIKENYEINYSEKRNINNQKEFKIYWKAKKNETYHDWFVKIYITAKQTKEIKRLNNNQQEIIPFYETSTKIVIEYETKEKKVTNEYLKLFEKQYKNDLGKPEKEEKSKYENDWKNFLKELKEKLDEISIKN